MTIVNNTTQPPVDTTKKVQNHSSATEESTETYSLVHAHSAAATAPFGVLNLQHNIAEGGSRSKGRVNRHRQSM